MVEADNALGALGDLKTTSESSTDSLVPNAVGYGNIGFTGTRLAFCPFAMTKAWQIRRETC